MLPDDTEKSAISSAKEFDDPRVYHFYDPDKRSGKALADSLGYEGNVAWDIYLFFSEEVEWNNGLPVPMDWMHQLKDSWADPNRYYTGDELTKKLLETMNRLIRR
jgi:hypothetical protein